ncbi:TetR-like C-terminal domain-containing protein [Prescottella sp. R16]|uniref:TetR-like C-terminal domain-containing protein n=1 Tax=Prescottella sp. R16 TaxID=3064529 RepID=UPI00272DF1E8|nr:TetR-like C-terminal domain-containing protein [Prescottella sp. R16]
MKRRGAHVTQAVHSATLELLTGDPAALTIAEVSKRADVHRTSIYRRWGTLDRLVTDAVLSRVTVDVPVPDTGSARADLSAFLRSLREFLHTPVGRALARFAVAPTAGADVDAERKELWTHRFSDASGIIERGIARGEICPTVDATAVITLATAPIHLETLTGGTQPAVDIDTVVAVLWSGIEA